MPVDREPTLEEYLGNLMKHELAYREYETLKSRAESSEAVVRESIVMLRGEVKEQGEKESTDNTVEFNVGFEDGLGFALGVIISVARRHGLEVE
jgi:hypothetical protein